MAEVQKVREVKLMKDEAMVTPVTLIKSVRNLDGSPYVESFYTRKEVNDMVEALQNAITELNKWV